jgi:hypothetical protein
VDIDLEKGVFSFLDRADMIRSLGMKPRIESGSQDYLVDFFILSDALYGTNRSINLEQVIEKLNAVEDK